jgi:hypothetical protein
MVMYHEKRDKEESEKLKVKNEKLKTKSCGL